MGKIIYTQIIIAESEIRIIVTAHRATLYKTIEAVATKKFNNDKRILSYWRERGKPQVTKHGIVATEEITIEGFNNYHCLFTL